MLVRKRNSAGELLRGPRVLKDPLFGTGEFDSSGDPIVDWEKFRTPYADARGFDMRKIEWEGQYYSVIPLPRGTILIRFGSEEGRFTAPDGTKYEELSLPYVEATVEFHRYEVIADSVSVACLVRQGRVAPMFNNIGGGIQYMHLQGPIRYLLRQNILKRIPIWG